MKGRQKHYSQTELFWIETNSRRPRREAHAEFCWAFKRDDVSLSNFNSLCKRMGWMTGRTGHFSHGQEPHNKGKPFSPRGSEKGRFKKGDLQGRAKQFRKPIGTERISKDGYVERKIHDGLPMQSRWRAVHLIHWEEENGPVPEGMCLKNLDGDKMNTDPTNWEAIPRALLPRLSGGRWYKPYDTYEPELRPTALAIAKLEERARRIKAEKKRDA